MNAQVNAQEIINLARANVLDAEKRADESNLQNAKSRLPGIIKRLGVQFEPFLFATSDGVVLKLDGCRDIFVLGDADRFRVDGAYYTDGLSIDFYTLAKAIVEAATPMPPNPPKATDWLARAKDLYELTDNYQQTIAAAMIALVEQLRIQDR